MILIMKPFFLFLITLIFSCNTNSSKDLTFKYIGRIINNCDSTALPSDFIKDCKVQYEDYIVLNAQSSDSGIINSAIRKYIDTCTIDTTIDNHILTFVEYFENMPTTINLHKNCICGYSDNFISSFSYIKKSNSFSLLFFNSEKTISQNINRATIHIKYPKVFFDNLSDSIKHLSVINAKSKNN